VGLAGGPHNERVSGDLPRRSLVTRCPRRSSGLPQGALDGRRLCNRKDGRQLGHGIREASDGHAPLGLGETHTGEGGSVVDRVNARAHGILDGSITEALKSAGVPA
jgi:hypothetical protein